MRYSVIIPFRDRHAHLKELIPHLRSMNLDMEIIVAEQNDTNALRRGALRNEGARIAKGEMLVLHDVDYIPTKNVRYLPLDDVDVYRAVQRVEFINMDGTPRPENDTPSGYRTFKDGIDANFFGGVLCIYRDAFLKIGGYNPMYQGWGLEDDDFRERVYRAKLRVSSGSGTFKALPHPDSYKNDALFQNNQRIFADNVQLSHIGIHNTIARANLNIDKATEYGVDKWLEVTDWVIPGSVLTNPRMDVTKFQSVVDNYVPTLECHTFIIKEFTDCMSQVPQYLKHRNYIIANKYGYGEPSFHWMWKLIVDSMPQTFRFLEIGVFCGQVTSLVQMLATEAGKNVEIWAVTPLEGGGPENQPMYDYEECIQKVYAYNNITVDNTSFVVGYSNTPNVLKHFEDKKEYFDIVFVDGGHEYEDVIADVNNFDRTVKIGGLMVMDDASMHLPMPPRCWAGLPKVSDAVEASIAKWPHYKHLFACMHDRVWQKTDRKE